MKQLLNCEQQLLTEIGFLIVEAFSWLLLRFYILFVGGISSQLISFRSHATLARRTKEQWQRREATIPRKPKARSDNSAETKSSKRQFRGNQKREATIPRKPKARGYNSPQDRLSHFQCSNKS